MKKIISLVLAMFAYIISYAASPNLQDITLTSSNGTNLDFYANNYNQVVYSYGSIVRNGTFYLGSIVNSSGGNTEARFSIELPMSYGMKKLSGTIYYNNSNGYVYSVTLDGSTYRPSSKTVAPRRR